MTFNIITRDPRIKLPYDERCRGVDPRGPRIGVSGHYTLKKYKATTGELVQEVGPFDNLITNAGLNFFYLGENRVWNTAGGVAGAWNNCFIGSGTATPAVTNTQLQVFGARTSDVLSYASANSGAPLYYGQLVTVYRFAAGTATGTWSEIGTGAYDNTRTPANCCYSRALILDGGGSPLAITVLADEYLDVTYTLRVYPDVTNDFSGSFVMSGVTYNYTGRVVDATSISIGNSFLTAGLYMQGFDLSTRGSLQRFNTNLASVTLNSVTGTSLVNAQSISGNSTVSRGAYTTGSYTYSFTDTFALASGNHANGICGMLRGVSSTYCSIGWQYLFDKVIPKNSSKIMTLSGSVSWGRYTP